ncbi:hypothetical protein [Vibrio europaeus]|uniref:hypothetical protein n=1 Tax=Vibrio europaeus TaxID=300876 RepID=UPI00148BE51B|nr:hypothetical protein [Vibrio europaeus]NOH24308.1 hypothetical protein [Vibrio europaeus]
MHKVDYSAWNKIQSDRHMAQPKFRIPNWFYTVLLVLLLVSVGLLVGKVIMFKPSEMVTIEPVSVAIDPVKISVDVNGLDNGHANTKVDAGNNTLDTQDNGAPANYNCPKIDFPKVPKGTSCIAVRHQDSITLQCGEQQVKGIPTLECLFERIPKDAFDVAY